MSSGHRHHIIQPLAGINIIVAMFGNQSAKKSHGHPLAQGDKEGVIILREGCFTLIEGKEPLHEQGAIFAVHDRQRKPHELQIIQLQACAEPDPSDIANTFETHLNR